MEGRELGPEIQSTGDVSRAEDQNLRWYAAREPLVLIALSLLAVLSFLAVAGVSKVYFRQQQFLGNRWFDRGVAALRTGESEQAVNAFRSALRFSPDDFTYQLSLAQALVAVHRSDEALVYLLNLWERQPENGTTSLELGRVYASRGEMDKALRYYHNAIYAAWKTDPDGNRRIARLELIEFLLRENAAAQAQSELIAIAANLPAESPLHLQVANLFLQAQDYEHAFEQYREVARFDHDGVASAGAGRTAFELGRYDFAQRYLEAAVAGNPNDTGSAALLHTAGLVLQLDPFRRQFSAAKRHRAVIAAFDSAGERLQTCSFEPLASEAQPPSDHDSANDLKTLDVRWRSLKPEVTEAGLRRNPDLVDTAMDLVFSIERQTTGQCGTPTETDQALLLIAKLHGSN